MSGKMRVNFTVSVGKGESKSGNGVPAELSFPEFYADFGNPPLAEDIMKWKIHWF